MLLSIIIPAYNSGRFIANTLSMLISQGLNDSEVIVIDDGSIDDTLEQTKKIVLEHPEIKVFHQENKGVSAARNLGMQKACGRYIYFLDSDDTLEDGAISHFRKILTEHSDCQMYLFGYKTMVNGKTGKDYIYPKYDKQVLKLPLLQQIFLAKKICCHICSSIYDSKLLFSENLTFTEGVKIGEDVEFILKYLAKVNTAYYSSRLCFVYQIRDDSTMQGYKKYSNTQYHSYEIRRDIALGNFYQSTELKNYSNFWIENQLLSNIVYYLRSDFNDIEVTNKLINDCKFLKRSIKGVKGALKNKTAINIAKILPMKTIIKLRKNK